jgi:hypothetical protein
LWIRSAMTRSPDAVLPIAFKIRISSALLI